MRSRSWSNFWAASPKASTSLRDAGIAAGFSGAGGVGLGAGAGRAAGGAAGRAGAARAGGAGLPPLPSTFLMVAPSCCSPARMSRNCFEVQPANGSCSACACCAVPVASAIAAIGPDDGPSSRSKSNLKQVAPQTSRITRLRHCNYFRSQRVGFLPCQCPPQRHRRRNGARASATRIAGSPFWPRAPTGFLFAARVLRMQQISIGFPARRWCLW